MNTKKTQFFSIIDAEGQKSEQEADMSGKEKLAEYFKKKKWIWIAVAIAVCAAAAIFVRFSRKSSMASGENVVRSAVAENGDISTTVSGTGNLENDTAESIEVPSGIQIETVYVKSGDLVSKGDVLATLNASSLMKEVLSLEEKIEALDTEIASAKTSTSTETYKARVSGRVKKIYCAAGDDAADVMRADGAMMLLSTDGLMAVNLQNVSGVSAGQEVKVTLADKEVISGEIESVSGTNCTVTMTDNGPTLNEQVTVSTTDGTKLGEGILYIHQQFRIVAAAGTVSKVSVSENQKVSSSTTLFTLKDVPQSSEYEALLLERENMANELNQLLIYAEKNAIVAEFDGVIGEVNIASGTEATGSGSTSPMSTSDVQAEIVLLSAADDPQENNTDVTLITDCSSLRVAYPVTGAAPQKTVEETESYTGKITWNTSDTSFKEEMAYQAEITLKAKSGYRFDPDIRLTTMQVENAVISGKTVSEEESENTLRFTLTFVKTKAVDSDKKTETEGGSTSSGSGSSISASSRSFGSSATLTFANTTTNASGTSRSSTNMDTDMVTAFTISPREHMLVTISVDELDILSVQEGQEVEVTLDALEGETFEGEVTEIFGEGTTNGGVTKYAVTIAIPRNEKMLAGMNASATIVVEEKSGVLTIPVDAVQEKKNRVFVYTEKGEDGTLSGEVEVTTGLSNGTYVEIVSGLSEGDTVYYQMAGTVTENTSNPFGQMPGGVGGGTMPGGEMPDEGSGRTGGKGEFRSQDQ